MEAVSHARREETALLATLLQQLRPVLPALVRPLQLLDVRAKGRPQCLHLRALQLFRDAAGGRNPGAVGREALFLLEDATFLQVRFATPPAPAAPGVARVHLADRLEGVEPRRVLRDHHLEDVVAVLLAAMADEVIHRHARARDVAAHATRLEAVRILLLR